MYQRAWSLHQFFFCFGCCCKSCLNTCLTCFLSDSFIRKTSAFPTGHRGGQDGSQGSRHLQEGCHDQQTSTADLLQLLFFGTWWQVFGVICLFICLFALLGGFQQHEHRVHVVSYLPSMSHVECYLPSMFHILSLSRFLFSFLLSHSFLASERNI